MNHNWVCYTFIDHFSFMYEIHPLIQIWKSSSTFIFVGFFEDMIVDPKYKTRHQAAKLSTQASFVLWLRKKATNWLHWWM